jgi:hypothetical protein
MEELMAKTARKSRKPKTAAQLIRSLPGKSVEAVIKAGKSTGLKITRDRVNCVRRLDKLKKKPGSNVLQFPKAERVAAAKKAAATRLAKEDIFMQMFGAKSTQLETQFMGCAVEIGFDRATQLLAKVRTLNVG